MSEAQDRPVGRPVRYFAGDAIAAIKEGCDRAHDGQLVQLEIGSGSEVNLADLPVDLAERLQVVPVQNLVGWAVRIVDIAEPVRASADADTTEPDSTGERVPVGLHFADRPAHGWGVLPAGREWENAALTAVTTDNDAETPLICAASRDADTGEFVYVRASPEFASDLAAKLQQTLIETGGQP